ncbi:Type 4 prepilin-like proteins leader peptide-processing enzyme [Caloramator mitchellensis]|uniref:Type 4 prepilin-like proteins leader peptide-processing enzyme n=1 Tax=Caloramator mitchellensis TaxID=908809 RepID=A0A0R3JTI9_CALMK|nr:Type 4 prepilin-like proteins leader peptide-processing enzyme [Caloramator mitchellensis]
MIFIIFLLGLIVGSFLNVCIYRIPRDESVVFPASHCANCYHKLAWHDLFPLFSYLFLKGRCRYCNSKISIRYPIIELLNGLIYILLFIKFGLTLIFIKYSILSSLIIVISVIDLFTTDIYTNTIYFGTAVGIIFIFIFLLMKQNIITFIIGALIGAGVISIIILTTHGMGWGDAELLFVIGLFLGVKLTIVTVFLSFILGGFIGSLLILLKIKSRKDYIPFGPFISLATLISILWGDTLLSFYIF